ALCTLRCNAWVTRDCLVRLGGLACGVLYIGRNDAGVADVVAANPAGAVSGLHIESFADPAIPSQAGRRHARAAAPCFLSGNDVRGLQSLLDGIATAI